jgi:hypothetical protein
MSDPYCVNRRVGVLLGVATNRALQNDGKASVCALVKIPARSLKDRNPTLPWRWSLFSHSGKVQMQVG